MGESEQVMSKGMELFQVHQKVSFPNFAMCISLGFPQKQNQ